MKQLRHTHSSPAQHGYTLIELSISITLIAIILGTALALSNIHQESQALDVTNSRLNRIESALQRFANLHDRLPCPAGLSVVESNVNAGMEDDCSAASPSLSGVTALESGTADELWIGAVPFKTLGLPDEEGYDYWNSRLMYVTPKNMAATGNTLDSETAGNTTDMIQIWDRGSANLLNPVDIQNPVVYVLISHGMDKRGAYNRAGNVVVNCGAGSTHMDRENCEHSAGLADNDFIDTSILDSENDADYFYDLVRWKTRLNLGDVARP